jgi:hypothetical protein
MTRLRVEHEGRGRLYISGGPWWLRLVVGIVGVALLGGGLALAATWPHPRTAVLGTLMVYLLNFSFVFGQARRRQQRLRRVSRKKDRSNLPESVDVPDR